MRINIKDSWLTIHKANDKKLYRKYRTFHNKILTINKLFYHHRLCNIPMHDETKDICLSKVNNYLLQMDKIYHLLITGDIMTEKRGYHYISNNIPLGTWENSMFIGHYISNIQKLNEMRADYEDRKKTLEKIKAGKTDNSIFNKVKSFFTK